MKVLLCAFIFAIVCCVWLFTGFLLDTYVGKWAFNVWILGPVAIAIYGMIKS